MTSVRLAWQEMKDPEELDAIERRASDLRRWALELFAEENRLAALTARDAFLRIWDDPGLESVRRTMLDERRNDILSHVQKVDRAFDAEKYFVAEKH